MGALQRWYVRWTGLWRTTGWWNAANALSGVVRYTRYTGDDKYARVIGQTYRGAGRRHGGFVVRYFDDNAWWALAWLDAYDLTGDMRYLKAARLIFENLTTAWDDDFGGVWWNTDRHYKNAITNELFLSVAARLHLAEPRNSRRYLDWALRDWEWFRRSGMIGPAGLVNDGLTSDRRNNGKPTYTYNQGVILGGLGSLYEITGDRGYLSEGEHIVDAVVRDLTSPADSQVPGVLVEPGEEDMAATGRRGDRSQFKGIFVRNLHDFTRHVDRPDYQDFIRHNADSIWRNTRNAQDQLGMRWTGPFDAADASRQSSALDALIAAAAAHQ